MLSQIDQEIFSDSCEVVEIPSLQLNVFLIFKNATSSIRRESQIQGGKLYSGQEISQLKNITVLLRNPEERYLSGVNTFVNLLMWENPKLDLSTVMFFINNYRFLNRHYLPQFHWLLNLSRMINPDCLLTLQDIALAESLTDVRDQPVPNKIITKFDDRLIIDDKLKLWFYLDSALQELIGTTLTFNQVLTHLKTNHLELYKTIIEPLKEFTLPAYGLP